MSDEDYLQQMLSRPAREQLAATPEQDEVYLKVWELEQQQTSTRWTVATFFLSVSFAIFGFSFQAGLAQPLPMIARASGLAIYWFAYALFLRFNVYTRFLRGYLRELEAARRTTLDVQTRAKGRLAGGRRSATWLLAYFGLLYTAAVVALWWAGV
jgi:hypothetical protein